MWRTSCEPGGAVEAGGFDDVVGDVDQARVEQDGVEAHGPPDVHDDDDQEGAVPRRRTSRSAEAPNALEQPVDRADLRRDLEQSAGTAGATATVGSTTGKNTRVRIRVDFRASARRRKAARAGNRSRPGTTVSDDGVAEREPQRVAYVGVGEQLFDVGQVPAKWKPVMALPGRTVYPTTRILVRAWPRCKPIGPGREGRRWPFCLRVRCSWCFFHRNLVG